MLYCARVVTILKMKYTSVCELYTEYTYDKYRTVLGSFVLISLVCIFVLNQYCLNIDLISRSSQCSTNGVTKPVAYILLSVGWNIQSILCC